MRLPESPEWLAGNQRELGWHLGRVRRAVEAHLGQPVTEDEGAAPHSPVPAALDVLCEAFGLSPFERDVLVLCAGVELDATLGALCALAHGDARRPFASFGLALAALPDPEWGALCPTAPLRRMRLVEVAPGEGLTSAALRIDERILHYLTGLSYLDERLRAIVRPVPPPAPLLSSQQRVADTIAVLCARPEPRLVWISGAEPAVLEAVAAGACAALGRALHALHVEDVPAAAGEREALWDLWEREAALLDAALLVVCEDAGAEELRRARSLFERRTAGIVMVASREPQRCDRPDVARFFVERPSMGEQSAAWREALGPLASRLNGQVDRLATHFSLTRPAMRAAVDLAGVSSDDAAFGAALWQACRQKATPHLDALAERVDGRAAWDDLVLPAPQKQTLREIAAQQRQRARVHESWGFARQGSAIRGLGASALFCGPSGTGKTMAAEVLAAELGLDLFRVDLSRVVSKYIGETEKNLRRVFDAAEGGSAVLLFDEADALFGKRSEVKDSHDRHANIEVSYLLQRMEAYRGLAILTTNMRKALDTAFLRRIRYVIEFPFPDHEQRADIWRRVFPRETPTDGLSAERLGRLLIAGGNIRNIALHAAFLAADAGEPVRMKHVAAATRSEFLKLEKPLSDADLGSIV
jgi:ATPase family associated with various cellular activities (AAA)